MIAPPAVVAPTPAPGPFPGFGRGIFVFIGRSPPYVVDLGWGVQFLDLSPTGHIWGRPRLFNGWPPSAQLCSNMLYYCLRSDASSAADVMSFAVPKRCGTWQVGQTWSANGVRSVVIAAWPGISPLLVDHPFPPNYLITDPERPNIVYRYVIGDGITEMFIAYKDEDTPALQAAARQNFKGPAPAVEKWRVLDIASPDRLAPCTSNDHPSPPPGHP